MPTPFGQQGDPPNPPTNDDNDGTSQVSTTASQPTDQDEGSDVDTVPWPIIAPNMIKPGLVPVRTPYLLCHHLDVKPSHCLEQICDDIAFSLHEYLLCL